MSLDSLIQFISSSGGTNRADADLAFAEVSESGAISGINPFGRLAWGWRVGSQMPADLQIALNSLSTDAPVELPVTQGGLHLKGMAKGNGEGWFVVGYEPHEVSEPSGQVSFRALMDRIPQPALCLNSSGQAWYANEAAARELGVMPSECLGRPALAELIAPEDRWKLAELMELAARDGSAHSSVRFGTQSSIGVLHLVQSVRDEFQAVILTFGEEDTLLDGSYVQESFYQSFLEQGPVGVLYLDASGRVTFENHYFRQIVGDQADASWLGLSLNEIPCLDESARADLQSVLSSTQSFTFTTELKGIGGSEQSRFVQIHASGILHPDGHVIGAAVLMEDRTELIFKNTEVKRLERSEEVKNTLRELATTSPDPRIFRDAAVAAIGQNLGVAYASLMGLSVSKDRLVEISSWSNLSDPPSPESIPRGDLSFVESSGIGQLISYGSPESAAICARFECHDCWITPVHDNAQFAGYLVFTWDESIATPDFAKRDSMRDLTGLFESLYSWIQLGARYQTTVASIDDALFGFSLRKDHSRRYHFATSQFALLTGYQPSELMEDSSRGVNWMESVIHVDDSPLVRAHNKTLMEGHESRVVYRICHRDGSTRWLREHATPRRDATGMTAVNGIISDVSEQKAAELVLLQAKKEAEASDRGKTAFIATMSHEIRTPLGAVNGFSQLLQKELEEFEEELTTDIPEQIYEFVSAISERSQKLQALVHDLFELSNIEMGKTSIQLARVSVAASLRAAVEKIRPSAERKGLRLNLSVHDNELHILGESRRLNQILDNLLSNAVKFTDEGEINVLLKSVNDSAVVEIEDTGVGIAASYLDQLFEAFSQEEDWRNRKYQGTGLGLALVKRLVEMMNGKVSAKSQKGKGSTFTLSFPIPAPYRISDHSSESGSGFSPDSSAFFRA